MICQARLHYESDIIANMRTNPRCFYSYIWSKKKVKDHIEYLTKSDGTKTNILLLNLLHEVLARFFSSVYVKENSDSLPHFPPRSLNQINLLSITEGDLLQKLSQPNISKTFGPDKIHAWILKEGRFGLCKPLLADVVQPVIKVWKTPQRVETGPCYTNI